MQLHDLFKTSHLGYFLARVLKYPDHPLRLLVPEPIQQKSLPKSDFEYFTESREQGAIELFREQ